jgi:hypothetical protein
MTKEQVKNLKPTEFKRFCGVLKETFKDMVTVLEAEKVLPKKFNRTLASERIIIEHIHRSLKICANFINI